MTAKRIKATIRWITDSWMVILFFVFFFLFWEWSVDWFSIPRYILPKPSTIVVNASADLPRLIDYTYITGLEKLPGFQPYNPRIPDFSLPQDLSAKEV